MYRWISSAAGLSFSVPGNFFPPCSEEIALDPLNVTPGPKQTPFCDVGGCNEVRKYRLVTDMKQGACGMEHLKVLEGEYRVACFMLTVDCKLLVGTSLFCFALIFV